MTKTSSFTDAQKRGYVSQLKTQGGDKTGGEVAELAGVSRSSIDQWQKQFGKKAPAGPRRGPGRPRKELSPIPVHAGVTPVVEKAKPARKSATLVDMSKPDQMHKQACSQLSAIDKQIVATQKQLDALYAEQKRMERVASAFAPAEAKVATAAPEVSNGAEAFETRAHFGAH